MKKKIVLAIILSLVMVLSAGCNQSQKSAATTGGGTKPSESKPADQGKSGSGEEPASINIYTFQSGSTTYIFGVTLADLINKNSKWLKATALEAPSPNANTMMLIEDDKQRSKIIGFMNPQEAWAGFPPFKKPYPDVRVIASYGLSANGFVTNNPNIKSLKDLAGKRVALGTNPSAIRVDAPRKAFELMGIKNVKFEYMTFEKGQQALLDKKVDALLSSAIGIDLTADKWAPNASLTQLLAQTKLHFLSYEPGVFDKAVKALGGVGGVEHTIPAGMIDKSQTEPWIIGADPIEFSADKSMPDRIVYEITRIMAENSSKFKEVHPAGAYITPQNMAKGLGVEEGKIHPGALKYYKEKNISIK